MYNTDKKGSDKKNRTCCWKKADVRKLVTNSAFNTKIVEVENKIVDVSELVTNGTLSTKYLTVTKKQGHWLFY